MKINSEELRTLVNQFDTGALNAIEFLLKVQLSPQAVQNLLIAAKLPAVAQVNLDVGDLMQSDDEVIEEKWTAADQARFFVADKILKRLGLDTSSDVANFSFYAAADDMGISARSDVMDRIKNFLVNVDRPYVNELNRLWTDKETFIEFFGPLPKDFAPILYNDDPEPFSEQKNLRIEYAKELLDWLSIEYTSAMLRSFKFYAFRDGFGVGIYTTDTNVRKTIREVLKNGKLPFTETDKEIVWLDETTFRKADNLRPPKGMKFSSIGEQ